MSEDELHSQFNACSNREYCKKRIAELEAELATAKQSYTDMFDGGVENLAEAMIENANLRGRFAAEKKQSYLEGVNAGMEWAAEIVRAERNDLASSSYNDALDVVGELIRKEIT